MDLIREDSSGYKLVPLCPITHTKVLCFFFKEDMEILSHLWALYCEFVFIFVLKTTSLSGKRALNLRPAWVEMAV